MQSNGKHPVEEVSTGEIVEKTLEEVAEANKPPRAARRRQEKSGRTATGVKLNKAAIVGFVAATQKRDQLMREASQAIQDLSELWEDVGLDPQKNYFFDEDGSVYIEPDKQG